jgi:hypothetical protein
VRRALLLTGLLSALAAESPAWPTALMQALNRDARRLVPRSLARLLGEREREVLEETRRFPPELVQRVAVDLSTGRLRPETLTALDAEAAGVGEMFRQQRISEGLVRLGGLMRIPADLADPVLSAGPEGYPAGVTGEYYAFVVASLDKIPVVLDDPPALRLSRRDLPDYWQGLVERSRAQSALIGTELFREGRLVDHRRIDFRSPVYGVASLSYSRAVTAIAATWIAVWRDARGDTTRMPRQRLVAPKEDVTAPPPARRGPEENPPPRDEGSMKARSR